MSKELEALEQSKEIIRKHCEKQPKPCYLMLDLEKPFNEIETELKEAKKLKKCYKNELKNVSYYNNLALKYKKIVDVIVAKEVDCNTLIFYLEKHNETGHIDYAFDSYNDYAKNSDKPQLTKKEFDLLKEVLL